ncbi:MAG: terpene cyclase/mutase family protein, partial [Candidatus Brocadiae bacterium]|nr:terpene cyclase/mutase family protein [Candidatus Brocadiia bacterium]
MTHVDDLVAFVREELGAAELASAREHVAACAACRQEAEALRSVFGTLETASIEPSAGFAARVAGEAAKLAKTREALRATEVEPASNFPWRVASAANAAKIARPARRGAWGRLAWIATRPVFGYPAWSVSAAVHLIACGVMALVAVERVEDRKQREIAQFDASHAVQLTPNRPADRAVRRDPGGFASPLSRRRSPEARTALLERHGLAGTEPAVEGALNWLAAEQQEDGSWNAESGQAEARTGATGLALLAFLGRGETAKEGAHAEAVRQGLEWLKSRQTLIGRFGPDGGASRPQHAIATAAVAEAYLLTGDAELYGALVNATEYIAASRSPRGGWGTSFGGTPDTVTTSWTLLALQLARTAGIGSAGPSIDAGATYLDAMTDESGRTALRIPGQFGAETALATAAALAARR